MREERPYQNTFFVNTAIPFREILSIRCGEQNPLRFISAFPVAGHNRLPDREYIVIQSLGNTGFIISFDREIRYGILGSKTDSEFLTVSIELGGSNNPNGFPDIIVSSCRMQNCNAGFLLNRSESASNGLKILQDAIVNNRKIGIHTDNNWAHAYDGKLSENGYTAGAYKIVAIDVLP